MKKISLNFFVAIGFGAAVCLVVVEPGPVQNVALFVASFALSYAALSLGEKYTSALQSSQQPNKTKNTEPPSPPVQELVNNTVSPDYKQFMQRIKARLLDLRAELKRDGTQAEFGSFQVVATHVKSAHSKNYSDGGLFLEFLPPRMDPNDAGKFLEKVDPYFFLGNFNDIYPVFKQSYIEAAMNKPLTGLPYSEGEFEVEHDDDDDDYEPVI